MSSENKPDAAGPSASLDATRAIEPTPDRRPMPQQSGILRRRLAAWQAAPRPDAATASIGEGSLTRRLAQGPSETRPIASAGSHEAGATEIGMHGEAATIQLAELTTADDVLTASLPDTLATAPIAETPHATGNDGAADSLLEARAIASDGPNPTHVDSGAATAPIGYRPEGTAPIPQRDAPTTQLDDEVAILEARVSQSPGDLDLIFELALALSEAERVTEARPYLEHLAAAFESTGQTAELSRVRGLLGVSSGHLPSGPANERTQALPAGRGRTALLRTGSLAKRDGRRKQPDGLAEPGRIFPLASFTFTDAQSLGLSLPEAAAAAFDDAERERLAGAHRAALDSILLALTLAPSSAGLWIRAAELRIRLRHHKKAAAILDGLAALPSSPNEPALPRWVVQRLRLHCGDPSTEAVDEVVELLVEAGQAQILSVYAARLIQRLEQEGKTEQAREVSDKMCELSPGDTRIALENTLLSLRFGPPFEASRRWDAAVARGVDRYVATAAKAAIIAPEDEREHWNFMALVLPYVRQTRESLVVEAYQRTIDVAGAHPIRAAGLALLLSASSADGALDKVAEVAGDRQGSATGRALAAVSLLHQLQHSSDRNQYVAAIRTALSLLESETIRELTDWEALAGFIPDAPALATELGRALLEAGDAGGASDALHSWHHRAPSHTGLVLTLADAYVRTNKLGSALGLLDRLAMQHRQDGKLEEMAAVLREMSRLAPTNIKLKTRLIDAFLQRGFVAEARSELIQRAVLEERTGDVKAAVTSLQRAADLSWSLGFMQESFDLYDRVLELDPEDVGNRTALVNLYLQVGRLSEAAEHQRALVDLALRNNRRHEAIAALHQVIGLTPDDMTAYYQLGELLSSMGEYQQAEKVYRRIVLMCPEDAVAAAKVTAMGALREEMTVS